MQNRLISPSISKNFMFEDDFHVLIRLCLCLFVFLIVNPFYMTQYSNSMSQFLLHFCQFLKYGNQNIWQCPKVLPSVPNSKCLLHLIYTKSAKMKMILLNSLVVCMIYIKLRKINSIFFIRISKRYLTNLLFVKLLFGSVCLIFDCHS